MNVLSIVIPAYNEERFIGTLLERIQNMQTEDLGFSKEIIVVDDGSRDRTSDVVSQHADVRLIKQGNQGKGAAVQRGIQESSGRYVLVQDADLEYDPQDYRTLLRPVLKGESIAVYGNRLLGGLKKQADQSWGPWIANRLISIVAFILYRQWINDPLTGYKLYPLDVLRKFNIKTHGFETDHELTAKLIRLGIPIVEVPVSYRPRSLAEGKKIRPIDGLIAVWTLFKFRFVN